MISCEQTVNLHVQSGAIGATIIDENHKVSVQVLGICTIALNNSSNCMT
jgi:hypothetical protein